MSGTQTCYFPDGSEATDDKPCQSPSINDGASACCNSLDVCLENHLCLAQTGGPMISRGSCTDGTWQSPMCSQYCADGSTPFENIQLLVRDKDQHKLTLTLTLF